MTWEPVRWWPYAETVAEQWVPPLHQPLALPEGVPLEWRCSVCQRLPYRVTNPNTGMVRWDMYHGAKAHNAWVQRDTLPAARRVADREAPARPATPAPAAATSVGEIVRRLPPRPPSMGERLASELRRPYNPED